MRGGKTVADDDDLYDDSVLPDDLIAEDDDEEDMPFSETSEIDRKLPIDHPKTDYDNDETEIYNEGDDEAAEANLPEND